MPYGFLKFMRLYLVITTLMLYTSDLFQISIYFIFFKKFNVYLLLRDREKQSMSMGGAEREEDTESEAGSRL